MRRPWRNLNRISSFNGTRRLALNEKVETTPFENVGRFDSRMCVARQRLAWLQDHVHHYRGVARYWAINLRQYLASSATTPRWRRLRTLRGSVARDEPRKSTNRARCNFCKISTRQHGCAPFIGLLIRSDLNTLLAESAGIAYFEQHLAAALNVGNGFTEG